MKIVVVGATGLVGAKMLRVLEERDFPVSELIPVASENSVGKTVIFRGRELNVVTAQTALEHKPVLALFAAGGDVSRQLAPQFADIGCRVVDNSSYWRMDPAKKLVVPEINSEVITDEDFIIANPNCSTIQMVLPLPLLHKRYGIKRIVVSTYQSVTGTGYKAIKQMELERCGAKWGKYEAAYPCPIDQNILPHIDSFDDDGYTKEEMKMVNETRKILSDGSIRITATAVRVPVQGGHSESVNIEFHKPFVLDDVRKLMGEMPGVVIQDDVHNGVYPMPINAWGRDEVFVGRIRRDFSIDNGLNFWCVADNLRKGAATNAVQIAEVLLAKGMIH